jgi:hypothetical protein
MRELGVACGHDLCSCTVGATIGNEAFCSDFCRDAEGGGIEQPTCLCGHPQCDEP